jgi:hypothetical protein
MTARQDAEVRLRCEEPVSMTPVPPGVAMLGDGGDRGHRPNGVEAPRADARDHPLLRQFLHNLMLTLGAWSV